MTDNLYPLKFHPILMERIWGGHKLKTEFNKTTEDKSFGESWEISDVKGHSSVVSNGSLEGRSLSELIKEYDAELIGQRIYDEFGTEFPLLIKFIDARTDLSIQLHPNDHLARERHDSFGKTEMWHVMQADPGSRLIVGFKDGINKQDYLTALENKTLPKILNYEPVKAGDTFLIEVGRVHAIGSGILLAEIQQTSDVTYRLYDWDRVDQNGKPRELHTDLALEAIDFQMEDDYRKSYSKEINVSNDMVSCKYFQTKFLHLRGSKSVTNDRDCFIIYIGIKGNCTLEYDGGKLDINRGETVLVPACIHDFSLISKDSELLEVYI